jgi:hypothetical protein
MIPAASLLRYPLPELVLAATRGFVTDSSEQDCSARLTGLHPLISVAISLGWRTTGTTAAGQVTPTTSSWSIYALQRTEGAKGPFPLTGNPLVNGITLPDGFETVTSAWGLQIDAILTTEIIGNVGEWVLTAEACPVDAELLLKCPELLERIYAGLKLEPLQLLRRPLEDFGG